MGQEIRNRHLCFCGKLAGMSRRDAETLARNNGAKVSAVSSGNVDLIVIGEENPLGKTWMELSSSFDDILRESFETGRLEVITETVFWKRLGLSSIPEPRSFYTPAAIGELVGVPAPAIRHWLKQGFLKSVYQVGKLPYFTFQEILAAKRLKKLLDAGYTPRFIAKVIASLGRDFPESERILLHIFPTSDPKKILYSEGKNMRDSDGQTFFDFGPDESEPEGQFPNLAAAFQQSEAAGDQESIPFAEFAGEETAEHKRMIDAQVVSLCEKAREQEDAGQLDTAVDLCRSALTLGGPDADISFQLAELLERLGDLRGARERYYVVLEMDDRYLEAMAGLGRVLDQLGQSEDAVILYRTALQIHPGYAEVRFELGKLLYRLGHGTEAEEQLLLFKSADPDSILGDQADSILDELRKRGER